MAFELKPGEPVGAGVTRNVRNQIEKAFRHAGAEEKLSENEAIAEVRKCFKRVRAALRLVREELGDDLYREENWCFRDAARPLTQVRDAGVLVETADRLRAQLTQTIGRAAFTKIRAVLVANHEEVRRGVMDEDKAFAAVQESATRALARLPEWRLQREGWAAVEPGLRRVYRAGHRALALAAENPSMENLHEWRKQAKYLWHHLQLLEATWTDGQKQLAEQTHKLSTLLGEDHDLAVLRETLAADPLAYGGHRALKAAFAVIDRQRRELEAQAFSLGQELYTDAPAAFTSRIGAWMSWKEAA